MLNAPATPALPHQRPKARQHKPAKPYRRVARHDVKNLEQTLVVKDAQLSVALEHIRLSNQAIESLKIGELRRAYQRNCAFLALYQAEM